MIVTTIFKLEFFLKDLGRITWIIWLINLYQAKILKYLTTTLLAVLHDTINHFFLREMGEA